MPKSEGRKTFFEIKNQARVERIAKFKRRKRKQKKEEIIIEIMLLYKYFAPKT